MEFFLNFDLIGTLGSLKLKCKSGSMFHTVFSGRSTLHGIGGGGSGNLTD